MVNTFTNTWHVIGTAMHINVEAMLGRPCRGSDAQQVLSQAQL